jgi:hypothetical protein
MRVVLEAGAAALREHRDAMQREPDGYFEAAYFAGAAEVREAWADHGAAILADWIRARPGTRPWAWWRFGAPEPRRCIVGEELLVTLTGDWYWRDHFGEPAFTQARPRGYEGLPEVEGQGAYLVRLGLLDPGERPGPETLEPEAVDPFLTYEGEFEELTKPGGEPYESGQRC